MANFFASRKWYAVTVSGLVLGLVLLIYLALEGFGGGKENRYLVWISRPVFYVAMIAYLISWHAAIVNKERILFFVALCLLMPIFLVLLLMLIM
jgi:hypothetical protein